MEIINQVISINKPCILEIENPSIRDWFQYNNEYKDILNDELDKIFSNTYNKLCMKYQRRLGRISWWDVKIKPTKIQYVFDFWDNGETDNNWNRCAILSGATPNGNIVCKLIVNINWL